MSSPLTQTTLATSSPAGFAGSLVAACLGSAFGSALASEGVVAAGAVATAGDGAAVGAVVAFGASA